jgi:hypothetical protein
MSIGLYAEPRLGLVAGYGMVTYGRGVCSGAAVLGNS